MGDWIRIAHRGASGLAPENTLTAFRRALEIGTDAIEFDVRRSRDGEVIVLHDATLDRTTDRVGAVAELTLEEMRRADAGVRFGESYRGERVPTLREVFDDLPSDVLFVVEIKAIEATLPFVQIVRETNRLDGVMAISFLPDALRMLRWLEPRIPFALLIGMPLVEDDPVENAREMLRAARSIGTSAIGVYWPMATDEAIHEIHRRAGTVWVWTVDEPEDIARFAETDIDGITSNYPDRLNAALRRL